MSMDKEKSLLMDLRHRAHAGQNIAKVGKGRDAKESTSVTVFRGSSSAKENKQMLSNRRRRHVTQIFNP